MRLSRTTSPNVNDQNEAGTPQPVTLPGMTVSGEVKADVELPAWQSAFVLGPNVRFTRTPESAYARKPTPAEVSEETPPVSDAAAPTVASVATETSVVAPAVARAASANDLDGTAMRRIESGHARTSAPVTPRATVSPDTAKESVEGDNGALALYLRLKREMTLEKHRAQPPFAAPALSTPQTIVTNTPKAAADRPHPAIAFALPISDYAFWESMSADVDFSGLAPAARIALPHVEHYAGSAAYLYREVAIRSPKLPVTETAPAIAQHIGNRQQPAPGLPQVSPVPQARQVAASPAAVSNRAASPAPAVPAPLAARPITAARPLKAPVVQKPFQQPAAIDTQARQAKAPAAIQVTSSSQAATDQQYSIATNYTPLTALPQLSGFQIAAMQVKATSGQWPMSQISPVIPHAAEPAVTEAAPAETPQAPTVEKPPVATIIAPEPISRPASTASRSLARSGLFATADSNPDYEFPPVDLLQQPPGEQQQTMTQEALEQSAGLLENILEDFGVKGEIIDVRPGPVVTLYEFEPAPGVKSSRVIGLSDDIARSMSALSARVAVVPGRNVIGIELPNAVRETVYFRELIECESYWETKFKLAVCLGKTIGGEPVIAELAKMPHLLVAGTTGSGKSVAINTMILSLLYRLKPEECRLIMVDPKMLELSVYDGIPHLLTPVVTDPKKAVMALKWAVREMEDRYRKMSRLGVRNIDGFNSRAASARAKGETVMCDVQKGFDRSTGEPLYEQEEMDLTPMPYIVVIVDEMADLMMVAGKEIEGAIQRLAQMARAAGIHLIMATQRPSVDVITGTIKANFPTRISFQVTSKIDSRTILGEQGAEHLLGQGDMLHMVGGGRIARVHGPFVSDAEVEQVVAHLKTQGRPEYLGTVTEDADEEEAAEPEDTAVFDKSSMAEEDGNDLYDKAVKVVLRDRKCSTSYIQRRLSIGYNRAASLVERMERDGLVGPSNHVGKREILNGSNRDSVPAMDMAEDED